jgi:hypothetical protein
MDALGLGDALLGSMLWSANGVSTTRNRYPQSRTAITARGIALLD